MTGAAASSSRSAWPAWLVPALLIALPFVWFWRGTTGQVLLADGDTLSIFFPMRRMFAEQVAAGVLPLWNPRVFSGIPFFAAMQTSMLYPPTWLFLVLPPLAAMNLLVIGHVGGLALAVYGYVRTIGCTRPAAAFGGSALAFGGFIFGHIGSLPVLQGMVWMPVLLMALERLRHRIGLRGVLLGAASIALALLTGHPQMPAYTLMVGTLYVAFFALGDRPPVGRLRYVGAAALAALGGVAFAAVQLVPGAELAAQSARPGLTYDDFVSFALPARQLPMLLFPFLFGGLRGVPYWGQWLQPELTSYPGIVPLMLAAAAFGGIRGEPLIRFWLLLALWSLLLALGGSLPLARLMYHVPVYNLFRAQVRNLATFDLAVVVLAALVLDRLPARRWRKALAMSAVAMLALVLAIAGIAVSAGAALWGDLAGESGNGPLHAALRASLSIGSAAVTVPVATAFAGAALACALLAGRARRWPIAGLAAVAALELGVQAGWLRLPLPRPDRVLEAPAYARFLATVAPGEAVARSVFAVPGGVRALTLLPASWGVPMVNGYDSMPLARYTELAGGMHYWGVIPDAALAGPARFLDVLNARYLVLDFRRDGPLAVTIDGVRLPRHYFGLLLRPGDAVELPLPYPVPATAVAAVTALGESLQIAQDMPVLRIDLIDASGRAESVVWRAGVHTAEWGVGLRPDVSPVVPHRKARVVENLPGGGHRYFGLVEVPRPMQVARVRIAYTAPSGALDFARLSLYDAASGRSHPLSPLHRLLADGQRWRPRWRGGSVVVLENLQARPRAWLVPATQRLDAAAALRTVQTGTLADGSRFDPATLALVEDDPAGALGVADPDARVEIAEYSPTRIALAPARPARRFWC